MAPIRVSPSATVLPTQIGVLLRTDLGTFQLEGQDVRVFLDNVLPLLDGSHDREEVAALLSGYSADSVNALLDVLAQYGLIEEVGTADEREVLEDFFRRWLPDPAAALTRLRSASIAIVGLEPWAVTAVRQLAKSGIGALLIIDDRRGDEVTEQWASESDPAALAAELAETTPELRVATAPLAELEAAVASLDDGALLLGTADYDRLSVLHQVAHVAQERGLRSLYGHIEGFDAVVGPVVVPGESACWECYRLRHLATADNPEAAHAIAARLTREAAPPRRRTYVPPMPALVGDLLALEAVKLASEYTPSGLVGRALVQNLVTLETSIHGVVRLPWCRVCGGAAAARPRPREKRSREDRDGLGLDVDDPGELRRRLEGWVDDRTGIVRLLALATPAAPEPELPVTASAILAAFSDGQTFDRPEIASGKGFTKVDALRSAVGEAIERYSAARYRREQLRRAPASGLHEPHIDPRDLILYGDAQYREPEFPFQPFDPTHPIEWAEGRWFDTGERVFTPALLTYFNYRSDKAGHFCQVTSNGLAAGISEDDAALRAVLELVERDAFMLSWLARRPGRRLSLDGALSGDAEEALHQLTPLGVDVELVLLESELAIPVIACLGFGDGKRWPGLTVALASDTDPVAAATKAILEHGHVGPYIRRQMLDPSQRVPERAEDVRSLLDHALLYSRPERAEAARFLLEGEPASLATLTRPTSDRADACRAALDAAGIRVAIADVTAPDVALGPLRVARAIGPHLQPIHFGYGLERRANPRLLAHTSHVTVDPHPLA